MNITEEREVLQQACQKLDADYGIKVHKFRRSMSEVAKLITLQTGLTGNPESVVLAYAGLDRGTIASGVKALWNGKVLKFDRAMRQAIERTNDCQPPWMGI